MKIPVWRYLLPALLLISINAWIPMIVSYNYAVHDLIAGADANFVGFYEFERALSDTRFTNAIGRNLLWTFLVLVIEVPLGIFIAKAMPKRGRLGGLCILLISIPLVLPWITIGLSWRLMVRSGGVWDSIFAAVGVDFTHNDTFLVYLVSLFCDIWHWTPLTVLVVSAGYAAMRPEPTEAAMIDRASGWAIFRHVEIPALSFPILMAVMLRFMDSLRVFDEPYLMFGDGAYHCVEFISTNIMSNNTAMKWGYAAAQGLVYSFLAFIAFYILANAITRGRGLK